MISGGKLGKLVRTPSWLKLVETSFQQLHFLLNLFERKTLSTKMSSAIWPSKREYQIVKGEKQNKNSFIDINPSNKDTTQVNDLLDDQIWPIVHF